MNAASPDLREPRTPAAFHRQGSVMASARLAGTKLQLLRWRYTGEEARLEKQNMKRLIISFGTGLGAYLYANHTVFVRAASDTDAKVATSIKQVSTDSTN